LAIKVAPRNFKFSRFAQALAAKFALRFKFAVKIETPRKSKEFEFGYRFLEIRILLKIA